CLALARAMDLSTPPQSAKHWRTSCETVRQKSISHRLNSAISASSSRENECSQVAHLTRGQRLARRLGVASEVVTRSGNEKSWTRDGLRSGRSYVVFLIRSKKNLC